MNILTFYEKDIVGNDTRIGSAYYMEADCEPIAVRIDAEHAPVNGDLEIDIFVDGVSIFPDHAASYQQAYDKVGPTVIHDTVTTTVALTIDQNQSELVGNDFDTAVLEEGSWVTCKVMESGSARNITVQLVTEEL